MRAGWDPSRSSLLSLERIIAGATILQIRLRRRFSRFCLGLDIMTFSWFVSRRSRVCTDREFTEYIPLLSMSNARILLGVNIDHFATLRQARFREVDRNCGQMVEPDPVLLALLGEKAGADGITVHPREDSRHIQRDDVVRLRACIQTRLNMEMAATDDMLEFALKINPDTICVVPESREEVSTEGGLEVAGQFERIKEVTHAAQDAGIGVSLFIDPSPEQIEASAEIGADFVELHTGAYANAYYSDERIPEINRLIEGAELADSRGLIVNAGHGINYVNINEIRAIPFLHELNIGHSIISRSVFYGLDEAVREMKTLMNQG